MRRYRVAALVIVVVAVVAAALLIFNKHAKVHALRQARAAFAEAGPRIRVTQVQVTPPNRTVTLPGDARPLLQATLYAKISGYVRELRVDKGDLVKEGDLLVRIESPETEQQVAAARSQALLSRQNEQRAQALARPGVISEQDLQTAQSNLKSSQAALQQTRELLDYTQIRAPFSGRITARYVDPGALVPAAAGANGVPMLDIADMSTLRTTIFVGQDLAPFIKPGDPAVVREDARPDVRIDAHVTRTAGALDPRTRTMLVEVQFDNTRANILPGTFVHVEVSVHGNALPTVQSQALLLRGGTPQVALVENGRLHFVPVRIGLSDARNTQILSGLRGDETVALDVPGEAVDGERVQPVATPPAQSNAPQGKAGGAAGQGSVGPGVGGSGH